MLFKDLSEAFEELEKVSSQTEMIKILADIFKQADEDEIDKICYYTLGETAASYKKVTLGMAEKIVQQSISLASNLDIDVIKDETNNLGDLGEVAFTIIENNDNRFKTFFDIENGLTIQDIDNGLNKITMSSGSGSAEVKQKILAAMLSIASPIERKYLVRLITRTMEFGVGEATVLNALASTFLGSKKEKPKLEAAYNLCSDIGLIAHVLDKERLTGIKKINITLHIPMKPMLAQRVSKFSEIKQKINSSLIAVEEKYDGERIEAHKDGQTVTLFSRRLTDVTTQYPDIVENVKRYIKTEQAILDGEAVAYNVKEDVFYPFQKLMQRRRKYNVEEYMKNIPVKYMLFDVIYRDGQSLMKKSYPERRKNLEEIVEKNNLINVANRRLTDNLDEVDEFFQECLNNNLEGVVCKSCSPRSYYQAGARKYYWIKWKKDYASELRDTLDLVVIGAYSGRGRRRNTYGSLLCTAYNPEKDAFQTVCKLGTGFSDPELENLPQKFRQFLINSKPARAEVLKTVEPTYYFTPKIVVEVLGAELTKSPIHTCAQDETGKGISLRFPRFIRWRPEKSPEDATTTTEILNMYTEQ